MAKLEDLKDTTKRECSWGEIARREIDEQGITESEARFSIENNTGYVRCYDCDGNRAGCEHKSPPLNGGSIKD